MSTLSSSTRPYIRCSAIALLTAAIGCPVGAQTFGNVVNVSDTTLDAGSLSVAVVSPNVNVVWRETGGKALYSRSTNSGQTFSTPIQIFKVATSGQGNPLVAATGSNVYVVRSASPKPNQPRQIFFKRSTNSGASFGNQVQVSAASFGAGGESMATSGASVYLCWLQRVGSYNDVFFARSTNGGASFSAPVNLSNTPGDAQDLVLAAEGSGVHVAWVEGTLPTREIFSIRSINNGASFGSVVNVSNSAAVDLGPAIAVSGPNVYLGWAEAEIRFAVSTDGGTTFSVPPVDLSVGGNVARPRLAASGSAVQVIWGSDSPGNYDIFHRASIDDGANFGVASNLSSSLTPSLDWFVAVNGANVSIAWAEDGEIFLVHSGNDGATFGTAVNVSTSSGGSGGPTITMPTPTEIHATWLDSTPGNTDVFFSGSVEI